ncbi:MAG: hypothetical protein GY906_10200 [bacterium]|nr:hypothetical protein [bacterium]
MTDYLHVLGKPCPITEKGVVEQSFSDHDRPGVFNACRYCHDDQRTAGQRLQDLERKLREEDRA